MNWTQKKVCGVERGSVVTELSLVIPILTFLILAVTDLGLFLQTYFQVSHIAREGLRTAVAVPDLGSAATYSATYRVTTDNPQMLSFSPLGGIPTEHRFIHDRIQLLLRADNGTSATRSLHLLNDAVSVTTRCVKDSVDSTKDKVELQLAGQYRPITPFNDLLAVVGFAPLTFTFSTRAEASYLFESCRA